MELGKVDFDGFWERIAADNDEYGCQPIYLLPLDDGGCNYFASGVGAR